MHDRKIFFINPQINTLMIFWEITPVFFLKQLAQVTEIEPALIQKMFNNCMNTRSIHLRVIEQYRIPLMHRRLKREGKKGR